MGTASEWTGVALGALCWAAGMCLASTKGWFWDSEPTVFDKSTIPGSLIGGAFFGMVSEFHWRAIHPPLLYVTLLFAVALIAEGVRLRGRRMKARQ